MDFILDILKDSTLSVFLLHDNIPVSILSLSDSGIIFMLLFANFASLSFVTGRAWAWVWSVKISLDFSFGHLGYLVSCDWVHKHLGILVHCCTVLIGFWVAFWMGNCKSVSDVIHFLFVIMRYFYL